MKYKIALIFLSAILLTSCGNSGQKNEKSVISQPDEAITENKVTQAEHPGKKVYNTTCLVCHMADGSGVPGMHPPIYESEFVNGDPIELVKIILEGKSGEVEVKGEVYNGAMPPQSHLSNQQIADVLTYIRSNFGNDAGPISPEDVESLRK